MVALNQGWSEFAAAFAEGDQDAEFGGVPLIFLSLENGDPRARFDISSFLLERECKVLGENGRGQTALHVLLGQVKHDIAQTTELCRRLLDRGVDPAASDAQGVSATQCIVNLKYDDAELSELFDVWFAQSGLVFDRPNRAGFSPRDLARQRSYRAEMVRRMDEYQSST